MPFSLSTTLRALGLLLTFLIATDNDSCAQSDLEKAAKALQLFSDTLKQFQNPNQQGQQNPYARPSPIPTNTNSRPDGSTDEIEWGTVFFPKPDDLFTSLVFSMRKVDRSSPYFKLLNPWRPDDFIGDPNSFIAVLLRPKTSLNEIKVTLSAEPYLRPSSITLRGLQAGAPKACKPSLNWDYSSLRNIPQSCPATLITELSYPDGSTLGRSMRQITVRSPNECPITPIPQSRCCTTGAEVCDKVQGCIEHSKHHTKRNQKQAIHQHMPQQDSAIPTLVQSHTVTLHDEVCHKVNPDQGQCSGQGHITPNLEFARSLYFLNLS